MAYKVGATLGKTDPYKGLSTSVVNASKAREKRYLDLPGPVANSARAAETKYLASLRSQPVLKTATSASDIASNAATTAGDRISAELAAKRKLNADKAAGAAKMGQAIEQQVSEQQALETTPTVPKTDLEIAKEKYGTTPTPTPGLLEPVNQPTLQDFIAEAQKLSLQGTQAQSDILGQTTGDVADAFARQLYSQNLGSTSGTGQTLAQRAIAEQAGRLEPYARQEAAKLGEQALGYQRDDQLRKEEYDKLNLEDQFALVQTGQITGPDAEAILAQKGIDPASFKTNLQIEDAELEKFKEEEITDPAIREQIGSMRELDYYRETGKTYEQDILDIAEENLTIEQWEAARPRIEKAFYAAEGAWASILSRTPADGWGGNESAYNASLAIAKWQKEALQQMLDDINSGFPPVGDITKYTGAELETPGTTTPTPVAAAPLAPVTNIGTRPDR